MPRMLAVAAVIVVLDQASKWWALGILDDRNIDLIGSLRLRLAFNTGTAFSLAPGSGRIIAVAALVVVVALVWMGRTIESRLGLVALGLLAGGAVGNLVDRAFRSGSGFLGGSVVDFIDVQWWPVFNVADAAIVIGGVLLVIHGMLPEDGVAPTDDVAPDRPVDAG